MFILNLRVTHKNAPQWVIEALSLTKRKKEDLISKLLLNPEISECVIACTCNRFELYLAGGKEEDAKNYAIMLLKEIFSDVEKYLEIAAYFKTIAHLFKLSASLESMIIGENQILSQVKEAYEFSRGKRATGPILDSIFSRAIKVGKRVRTETKISKGGVSISSSAVELAESLFLLQDKKIMIVGAGKMAELVGKSLAERGVEAIYVSNRTYDRAKQLATELGGFAIRFDNFLREDADLLITATSAPHAIIHRKDLESLEKNLVIIDIAMPSDVSSDVLDLENVRYFNIDSLKSIAEENMKKRLKEVERCERIIAEEIEFIRKYMERLHIEPLIASIRQQAEEIRREELMETIRLLKTDDEKVKRILDDMSKSIVNKILHYPVTFLRSENPREIDMEKFRKVFFGGENVSKNKNEKVEKIGEVARIGKGS
ncbi:MAG: glutamyl-tRNA reductase [Candidatus Methanofastidiosia archaeon]